MGEAPNVPGRHSDYFVGVPAPAGAALVLLPAYLGFLGVERTQFFAYASTVYAFLVALLLISRLPVYSGKGISTKIHRDIVLPLILVVVLYVSLLANYTWQTLVVSALLYLGSLPFGFRAYSHRAEEELGGVEPSPEEGQEDGKTGAAKAADDRNMD
jgi:CDP-diacylglycerol--serine O-phosphatidyltransferase